jgi:hypothetical protein
VPESIVNVTEGSGKLLHTFQRVIGSNTVEDEVTLQGEPYLASYTTRGYAVSIAATSHLFQLMAGPTLKVYIRRIRITQAAAATTAGLATFGIVRLTSAGTGGTGIGGIQLEPTDPGSGAAGMVAPTVAGTISLEVIRLRSLMSGAATTTGGADGRIEWTQQPGHKALIIAPGIANGIAIQNLTAIAGAQVDIMVDFAEANF